MTTSAEVSAVDRLLAVEEIKRLKARYFRCVDSSDWEGFRSVFADDAEFAPPVPPPGGTTPNTRGPLVGGDAFVAYVQSTRQGDNAPLSSVHRGTLPEIEVVSADEATGIWAMEDIITRPTRRSHGYGRYHERYRRVDGRWVISSMALVYSLVDVTDRVPPAG
jgi:hypothetical protein